MAIQSDTKTINTNGEFVDIETLLDVTFSTGTKYTIHVTNAAIIKIANAELPIENNYCDYTAGTETLYIKTLFLPCTVAILENEES